MKSFYFTLILLLFFTISISAQCWKQVTAGINHTLAIKEDGTLWGWGINEYGQLGDGTLKEKYSPVQIGKDTNWLIVKAGKVHTVALKTDGTLWTWGGNTSGQLGDGTTIDQNQPIQIGNETNWQKIMAGWDNTYAIKTDGTLWAWGENDFGQLGINLKIDQFLPVQVGISNDWDMISSGSLHALALKKDGTLWAWGQNGHGKLGDGSGKNQIIPIEIGNETNWKKVSAKLDASFALKKDGTLWGWGYFATENLGANPKKIGLDSTWQDMSTSTSLILTKKNKTIWRWDITTDNIIKQIGTETNWIQSTSGFNYNLAIKEDNTLWSWGANDIGQLGLGASANNYFIPVHISCFLTETKEKLLFHQNLKLYPNPAHDYVRISLVEPDSNDLTYEIRTLLGIAVSPMQRFQNDLDINIEKLVPGIYFVIIRSPKGMIIKQFIKI